MITAVAKLTDLGYSESRPMLADLQVEASDLGFAPGHWPDRVVVERHDGQAVTYDKETVQMRKGSPLEVSHVVYRSAGRRLTVWND